LLRSDEPSSDLASELAGSRREVGRLVTSGHRIWSPCLTPLEVPLPISRVDRKPNYEMPVPPALRFPPDSPGYLTSRKSGYHSPVLRTDVTEQQAFAVAVATVPFSNTPVFPAFPGFSELPEFRAFPVDSVFSMNPALSAHFELSKEARP